jgi:polar amino acid transport system substrate-binding protein
VTRWTQRLAVLLVLPLMASACGGGQAADETGEASSQPAAAETTSETASDGAVATGACSVAELPLVEPNTLTVATGEPVFEPWMVDDDPTNKQGFESALVYALAERMGFSDDQITWVRTGFDEAIAPGEKPYDFNIQQYSISEERDEVVDFSIGYYEVEQALVAAEDSPVAQAKSVADLKSAHLGAAIGTTSLDYIEEVIQPDTEAQVFDDNAAAKAAFDAGQVDGLVFDLPTAYFITAVEIPDASIVGVLPREAETEELGLLFSEGSELVDCVDRALQTLIDDGTVAELEEEWLTQSGEIPTLTN